ncbi:MAG: PD-(D/E)XK nuclease family transposase [Lachnospiraceae bacterium]|nr:PD-(D/E)XK nuclease family transposase [Lachnospiraceae bacterium]
MSEITAAEQLINMLNGAKSEKEQLLIAEAMWLHLNEQERNEYNEIVSGKRLPSLMSDVVAKTIFHPENQKRRVEYLLRKICKDESITIDGSFTNEGYLSSVDAKKIIFDIPVRQKNGMLNVMEVQVASQDYIFKRSEIYVSDLVMMQYAADRNKNKGMITYNNVKPVCLVVFMRYSPKSFRNQESKRYIHRITQEVTDSGLSFPSIRTLIFVELGKCLKQFRKGINGEQDNELQLMLAAMADVNNRKVRAKAKKNTFLMSIYEDVQRMALSREGALMMLAEKYYYADLDAVKSFERGVGIRRGRQEGRQEGRKEGRQEGKLELLYELANEGELSIAVAAKRAGVDETEFCAGMDAYFKKEE